MWVLLYTKRDEYPFEEPLVRISPDEFRFWAQESLSFSIEATLKAMLNVHRIQHCSASANNL